MPVVESGPQQPHKKWALWQVIAGWVRKILNAGHSAGMVPKKTHKPRF